MHSVVWGIHRFPGWLFLALICVCMCASMCVLAICMSMSLTQSICYTSSGTNLSNLSCDCVVPPNLEWFMCVCVSTCTEQPHIILHYSDSALSLMSLHIWSWAHVSFLDFKRLIKCQTICNHFPTTSLGLTTVDQGHLTVTHEHSCVHYHPSCALYECVCVCAGVVPYGQTCI